LEPRLSCLPESQQHTKKPKEKLLENEVREKKNYLVVNLEWYKPSYLFFWAMLVSLQGNGNRDKFQQKFGESMQPSDSKREIPWNTKVIGQWNLSLRVRICM
jgi:hypothetical protein